MPARAAKLKMVAGRMVSAKSRTGSAECSKAVSLWVLGRKAGTVAATVYQTLAKCRAMAAQNRKAEIHQAAGKLAAGRGTWQRSEQAKSLVLERAKKLADRYVKEKRARELNPKPKTKVAPAKKAAPKPKPTPPPKPTPKATTPAPKPPADHVAAHRAAIEKAHETQRKANAAHAKANPELRRVEMSPMDQRIAAGYQKNIAEFQERIRHFRTLPPTRTRSEDIASFEAGLAKYQAALDRTNAIYAAKPTYAAILKDHPDVIPPGPIADRIKTYSATVGRAKLEAIGKLGETHSRAQAEIDAARMDAYGRQGKARFERDNLRQLTFTTAGERKRLKALTTEVDAISDEILDIHRRERDLRDRMRDDLTRLIAPHGPTMTFTTKAAPDVHPMHVDRANEASAWLSKVTAAGDTNRHETKLENKGPATAASNRAHYDQSANTVRVEGHELTHTHVHEQVHALEYHVQTGGVSVQDRGIEFRHYRVGSEPLQDLEKLFPAGGFMSWERGAKDHFEAAFPDRAAYYCGKDTQGDRTTEINTMGVEKLFNDPLDFAKKDPEYLAYILGTLDGSLR